MVKAIIFDCFGVLYRGSLEYLYEIVPESSWGRLRDLSRAANYGFISLDEYTKSVAELSGESAEAIRAAANSYHTRNDQLVDYINKDLKPKYKIGLLSNIGRGEINSLFDKSEQDETFDAIVLSSDVGLVKPSAEIYRLIAGRLNIPPESCIMIDDIQSNVDGAQAVGMMGITYQNNKQLKQDLAEYGVE